MLTIYTLGEAEQWDRIVRSFENYDIYWLCGYVKAFFLHGDGEPLLFYYNGKNDTRAINVVMKRDIARDEYFIGKIENKKYFDFVTPYGYGGWLIEGKNTEELFDEYENWCQKNAVISEFVRFHPMIKNHEKCDKFYEITGLGEVVHMDLSSPEIIWENITSKNRNMIRKAVKNDVKIYNGRFPEIYKKFQIIYNRTMDKDHATKYYYFGPEFYKSVLEDMPQNAQVFYAEKDGVIIAASVILAANKKMNYHLSGSLPEYSSLAATNFILYMAALWGSANGYKTFYLGGGVGSEEDSLFKFKRAFYRGDLHRFYIGGKIYDQSTYDRLLRLRHDENDEIVKRGFFPQYRG